MEGGQEQENSPGDALCRNLNPFGLQWHQS